jgi:DNA polymerase-3 subunit alpha (Gram-positive type)
MTKSAALNQNNILDVFPQLSLKNGYAEFFRNVKVLGVNVYRKSKRLEIRIEADTLITASLLEEAENSINAFLGFESVEIKPKFNISITIEEILNKYWESIIFIVNKKVALSRGILSECDWVLEDQKLIVRLKTTGSDILRAHGCHSIIEGILKDSFSSKLRVYFEDFEVDEEINKEYLEFKEKEELKALAIEESSQNGKSNGSYKKKNSNGSGRDVSIIIGNNFNDTILKMSEITQESGKVAISGDAFAVEFKEIRGGRYIFKFDITDYSSSLTVKFFVRKDAIERVSESIKDNVCLKVRGEAQYDKFSRDLVIMASAPIMAALSICASTAGCDISISGPIPHRTGLLSG